MIRSEISKRIASGATIAGDHDRYFLAMLSAWPEVHDLVMAKYAEVEYSEKCQLFDSAIRDLEYRHGDNIPAAAIQDAKERVGI